jgi:endonuclease/exonuclease/phosphatase family metal-dependent hydrolase
MAWVSYPLPMERLKLLTLNIWNRQGPWERRFEVLRAELRDLDPDVVGLQEVLSMTGQPSQAVEIAGDLGYRVVDAPGWVVGGGLCFGNAILSRWEVLESQTFPLPGGEGTEPRCAGYALIDAPCGRVPIFVTHLAWKLHEGSVRLAQARELVARVQELCPVGSGFPPILLGDFNAEPEADEIRYLRGLTGAGGRTVYFCDCFGALAADDPALGPGHTYSRRNPYALRSREPSRRIDYVFVRGPDRQLRGEPLLARVVFDQAVGGVFASDHFGVYAEVQAAPRALDPY